MILGTLAAVAVVVVGFLSLRGNDASPDAVAGSNLEQTNGTSIEQGNADAGVDDDAPSARAVLGDTEVLTVDGIEASFPLFPESERHLLIGRRGDQLVLIDSESGAMQTIQLRSGESFDEPVAGYSIGSVLERLLVVDSGFVRSFSLTGGADFDLSNNVAAFDVRQGPRVVVASQLSGVNAQTVYEVQAFGSYEVFPGETGIVPLTADVEAIGERVFFEAGGQIFEHRVELEPDGGFVALGSGKLLGAGRNHIIIDECSEGLECQALLVDAAEPGGPVSKRELELPQLTLTPLRVSPDGAWIVAPFGGGVRAMALDEDQQIELLTTPFLGVSWTNDSRYLVATGLGSALILDTTTGESSNVDIDGTGEPFDELLVVLAPSGWTPTP